jgi:ATP-dependent DNA ligase
VLGCALNNHIETDGPSVFARACRLGLEGIVSKRKNSRYRTARSPDWLKAKNPASEAVAGSARRVETMIQKRFAASHRHEEGHRPTRPSSWLAANVPC